MGQMLSVDVAKPTIKRQQSVNRASTIFGEAAFISEWYATAINNNHCITVLYGHYVKCRCR